MSPPKLTLNTQFTIMAIIRDRTKWKEMAQWVKSLLGKN